MLSILKLIYFFKNKIYNKNMPQDIFTLKRTISQLNNLLQGSKINKITQPSQDEIVLTLYKNKVYNLTLSTFAKFARVSLTELEKPNPITAPNFCMLLRKYVQGGQILDITLLNNDRIVKINVVNKNDFKELNEYELIIEVMGKYSNVFLTRNNVILGTLKQGKLSLDSKRIILIGSKYSPPIKPNKFDAYMDGDLDLVFKDNLTEITGNFILNSFINFAPITADEISFRINKNFKNGYDKTIAKNTLLQFLSQPLNPTIISGVNDFFSTDYLHLLGERKFENDFLLLQANFYDNLEKNTNLLSVKTSLNQKLIHEEQKEFKKLSVLREREKESNTADKYRIYGELLTNNLYRLNKGVKKAVVYNYYEDKDIEIPLSIEISPQENAKKYFKKYNKLKNAYEITIKQIEETLNYLDYISSIKSSVEIAENLLDLKIIEKELVNIGLIKSQTNNNKSNKLKYDFLTYEIDGFIVKVGKSNLQNEELLSTANKGDIWLHAKNFHSCFVILFTNGNKVLDKTIKTCAEICAYYSQGRNANKVEVSYTQRKNVKKPPKAKCGMVIYSNYSSILVEPNNNVKLLKK